jgi:hypothetical protein
MMKQLSRRMRFAFAEEANFAAVEHTGLCGDWKEKRMMVECQICCEQFKNNHWRLCSFDSRAWLSVQVILRHTLPCQVYVAGSAWA